MENINKINTLVDKSARNLVGVLCKRIEVLEREGKLTSSLYKALIKELVYENFRCLKEIFKVYFEVGTIIFTSKKKS